MAQDQTQAFLQSLPQVEAGEEFWFACHSAVPCFNACCSDLTMPLTPYDVLRLQTGLALDSDSFFEEFADIACMSETGFPTMRLRMAEGVGSPCPFLTKGGCGVYEHRSSACRTYPLGRATQPENPEDPRNSAVVEKFFLVREDHCKGFAEQKRWDTVSWLKDQGLEPYIAMNDRYMRLIAIYKSLAKGSKLSSRHATMALLCLYQMDRFADFIKSTKILDRLVLQGEWAAESPTDFAEKLEKDASMRLIFGMEWLELVLFGQANALRPALG